MKKKMMRRSGRGDEGDERKEADGYVRVVVYVFVYCC
jgi:hypothetical protein